ncbi:MAG: hypothetical protein UT24_C0015G0015 [Candidatus Woesebacteria bacterium GW2011_GWB1_39_12]|uniref:Uncharacterized protein n=1 Tax=Candidatus Woesebacteria bacterium GW2011_GWB1_39_12 TaxID=1618574 RepID=A0A0G0QES2_9BACT|nr:MAG: hypothetical protein UT24_C0015G0015 [Candidatus Woesebacteria bacterium GW2011_GWB1_39_12]
MPKLANQDFQRLTEKQRDLENVLVSTMKDIVYSDIPDADKAKALSHVIKQGRSEARSFGLSIDFEGLLERFTEAIQNLTKSSLPTTEHLIDTQAKTGISWLKLSQQFSKN